MIGSVGENATAHDGQGCVDCGMGGADVQEKAEREEAAAKEAAEEAVAATKEPSEESEVYCVCQGANDEEGGTMVGCET